MKNINLFSVFVILIVSIVAISQYYLRKEVTEDKQYDSSDCQLRAGECHLKYDHAQYVVSISGELKALQPFFITIADPAQKITNATVKLTMKDMDMGLNHYSFIPTSGNRWRAKVIIPVCTTGKRTWQIELTISDQIMTKATIFVTDI